MAPSYPPLPPDLVEFVQGGRSLIVGTCSAALEPECVRGVGLRVWPCACKLTLLIPNEPGAQTIANLRETGRVAITLSYVPTLKTIQLKGRVLAIRAGDEADHALARRYRELFAPELAFAGMAPAHTSRLAIWPCCAVEIDLDVVYAQTPGPTAGEKLPLAERA
ncbi:MAG TPA: pyridoxamine 5'-phosphate oxidase family protein [Kofleriaceae bacterium]|nr:pyridoxamine 5'-phosphate oxidase family protein [Kofleriaceae bacterium]